MSNTTSEEIRKSYPLPVYNYKVEIDGQSALFSEMSGLSIRHETIRFAESPSVGGPPGPRLVHIPEKENPLTVTLKKGFLPAAIVPTFFNWINSIQINSVDKKDIYIRLCDEKGDAVISWKVINAFPTKLDAPTFADAATDATVESMELMADSITIETL